jgi:hypothetical protein
MGGNPNRVATTSSDSPAKPMFLAIELGHHNRGADGREIDTVIDALRGFTPDADAHHETLAEPAPVCILGGDEGYFAPRHGNVFQHVIWQGAKAICYRSPAPPDDNGAQRRGKQHHHFAQSQLDRAGQELLVHCDPHEFARADGKIATRRTGRRLVRRPVPTS